MEWRHTVWPTAGLVYTAIAKVANTSLKSALLQSFAPNESRANPHASEMGYQTVNPRRVGAMYPTFIHFAAVRNPFDRLVSFWADKIDGAGMTPGLGALGFTEGMSFEETASLACGLSDGETDPHIRSQSYLLANEKGRLGIDYLLRFESLSDDWEALSTIVRRKSGAVMVPLPKRRTSKHAQYQSYYEDSAIRALVADRYRMDFDLLGYSDCFESSDNAETAVPEDPIWLILERTTDSLVLDLTSTSIARAAVVRSRGGQYISASHGGPNGQVSRLSSLENGKIPESTLDGLIVKTSDVDGKQPHTSLYEQFIASGRPVVTVSEDGSCTVEAVEAHLRPRRVEASALPLSSRLAWRVESGIDPGFVQSDPKRADRQRRARSEILTELEVRERLVPECPTCGSSNFRGISQTERFGLPLAVSMCANCGLVQAAPRPVDDFYDEFLSAKWRELAEGEGPIADRRRFTARAGRRPENLARWAFDEPDTRQRLEPGSLVVHVGCGEGFLLSRLVRRGFRGIGFDLDPKSVEAGRSQGLDVRLGGLGDLRPDERPAVVSFVNTLDTLTNPQAELALAAEQLGEGGLLFVAAQGLRTCEARHDGDVRRHVQARNLFHFTLASLSALALQSGFRLLRGDETIRSLFELGRPGDPSEMYPAEREATWWHLNEMEGRLKAL